MGKIEAGVLIAGGRVIEGGSIPAPVDAYYEVVVTPGFSDTHAHPQVVDGGLEGGPWRDSYHWISTRRLRVDEASLRADRALASRLARLTLWRALFEGVTLIALTGRLEANVDGYLDAVDAPRVVFLPTIMRRKGWPGVEEVERVRREVEKYLVDGLARVGVFIHSLEYTDPATLRRAVTTAAREGSVVGMHLGEGRPELARLLGVLGGQPGARLVAVHCIDDDDPVGYGLRCSACPATNLLLYRRTRKSLAGVTSFGSDWPLLLGSMPRHLGLIRRLWPGRIEEVLAKATIGGYVDYGMPYWGDIVAYDSDLHEVIEGRAVPSLVVVAWKPVVEEGVLASSGLGYADVLKMIRETVKEALEAHPSGEGANSDPLDEAERAFSELLLFVEKDNVSVRPQAVVKRL